MLQDVVKARWSRVRCTGGTRLEKARREGRKDYGQVYGDNGGVIGESAGAMMHAQCERHSPQLRSGMSAKQSDQSTHEDDQITTTSPLAMLLTNSNLISCFSSTCSDSCFFYDTTPTGMRDVCLNLLKSERALALFFDT